MQSEEKQSYGEIMRSTVIVGGASAINVLLGIFRIKIAALAVGPAGIGLIGVLTATMTMCSSIASVGMGASGVRQLAASKDDRKAFAEVKSVLLYGGLCLGLLAMTVLWLFRGRLSSLVFDSADYGDEIGWISIGVLFSLISISSTALLRGVREIGALAKVNILATLAALVVGSPVIWFWREQGIAAFVVVLPVASALLASVYVKRLVRPEYPSNHNVGALARQFRTLLALGGIMMVAGLVAPAAQLYVRGVISKELGLEATGLFQASWQVSMTYLGFVLAAMGADFFPRLSGIIDDREIAIKAINEQAEVAMLLGGPMLIAMIGFAPWVISALYSTEFEGAADVLRWQILGDIMKLMAWPLGFGLIALGRGGLFFVSELVPYVFYLGLIQFGIDYYGLLSAGVAFFAMYIIYFILVSVILYHLIGFRWSSANICFSGVLLISAAIVFSSSSVSDSIGAGCAIVATGAFGLYGIKRIDEMQIGGRLGGLIGRIRSMVPV